MVRKMHLLVLQSDLLPLLLNEVLKLGIDLLDVRIRALILLLIAEQRRRRERARLQLKDIRSVRTSVSKEIGTGSWKLHISH